VKESPDEWAARKEVAPLTGGPQRACVSDHLAGWIGSKRKEKYFSNSYSFSNQLRNINKSQKKYLGASNKYKKIIERD
jgi:hypothetical protein